jgi:hypothetical protein
MKKVYKKYGFKEYYLNSSKLCKLYHLYMHQTVIDQILDVLVFFAIFFTIMEVCLQLFFNLSYTILHILHSFSVLILFVFGLELFREYALSRTKRDFFKKHWMDFILVVTLSFYFLSATYFGLAKFKIFASLGEYARKLKEYKIVYNTFFQK